MEKHILLPIRCNKTQIRTKDSARLGTSLAWETTIKKPLEVRIIYHEMAVNATGQKIATMMPSSAGGHFVILL